MKTNEFKSMIRELTSQELEAKIKELTGQLENTARISQVRKSIARMKTVIRERELANK